jgi:pimeloyl-ACP methyl ester carboxylesterase
VRSTLDRVIAELDEEPLIVSVRGREIGLDDPVDVVMDGSRVAELSFLVLYQESLVRHLPAVLAGLDDREPAAARWLAVTGARLQIGAQAANDEGTYFAVQCRDRLPFTDGPGDGLDPFASVVAALSLADVCGPWRQPPAPASAAEPVRSDIPTLTLSGAFDPITPAEYGRDVATRLTRATVVEQAGRGHGIWYGDDCIATIVDAFVADPGGVVDTGCAAAGVPVEWEAP